MKNNRLFWLLSGAPLLLVPFCGGCNLLHAPDPEPIAPPVPQPKPPFFDPAAGMPDPNVVKHLNAPNDPKNPDAFRIASPLSGDTVALQSVDNVKGVIVMGTPDTVKLAGIIASNVEPGLQGARSAITGWTVGQNLDVDLDPKFPHDLTGRRMVQVYFKGHKGPYEGKTLSLNRMLVRSGWAVVDLYSPTSFDISQWLLDEAYARQHALGVWNKPGQTIQQRVPLKVIPAKGTRSGKMGSGKSRAGKPSSVQIIPTDAIGIGAAGRTQTTTKTTTQTITSGAPVAGAGAQGAPATGVAAAGAPPIGGTPAGAAVTAPGAVPPPAAH